MQYLLTKDEYERLEDISHYESLNKTVDDTLRILANDFCPRIHQGKKYCDGCSFLTQMIRKRYSEKRACPLSVECSK